MPHDLPILGNAAFGAGTCTLIIEECAIIFRRGEILDDWAKRLIFMGRHQSVNLVLIAQRAAKIPIDIRSQASRVITFRQTEPDDVAAIAERIGFDARDEIPALPDLHCIDWDNGAVRRYPVRP
jgi:DNA helicase HerA-like ATPase